MVGTELTSLETTLVVKKHFLKWHSSAPHSLPLEKTRPTRWPQIRRKSNTHTNSSYCEERHESSKRNLSTPEKFHWNSAKKESFIAQIKLFAHINAKSGLLVGPFCGEYSVKTAGILGFELASVGTVLRVFFLHFVRNRDKFLTYTRKEKGSI